MKAVSLIVVVVVASVMIGQPHRSEARGFAKFLPRFKAYPPIGKTHVPQLFDYLPKVPNVDNLVPFLREIPGDGGGIGSAIDAYRPQALADLTELTELKNRLKIDQLADLTELTELKNRLKIDQLEELMDVKKRPKIDLPKSTDNKWPVRPKFLRIFNDKIKPNSTDNEWPVWSKFAPTFNDKIKLNMTDTAGAMLPKSAPPIKTEMEELTELLAKPNINPLNITDTTGAVLQKSAPPIKTKSEELTEIMANLTEIMAKLNIDLKKPV